MRENGLWFAYCVFSGLGFKQVTSGESSYKFLLAGIVLCRACQPWYKLYSTPSSTHLLGQVLLGSEYLYQPMWWPQHQGYISYLKVWQLLHLYLWTETIYMALDLSVTWGLNKNWLYNHLYPIFFSSNNASMTFYISFTTQIFSFHF